MLGSHNPPSVQNNGGEGSRELAGNVLESWSDTGLRLVQDHITQLHELLQPQVGSAELAHVKETTSHYTTVGGHQKGRVYDIDMEEHAINGATTEGSSSSAPMYTEEQFQRQVGKDGRKEDFPAPKLSSPTSSYTTATA
ncbi:hypothetical protein Sjap_003272 [Stephania japonica]|uniref:Uncharacterized protein n=1 Tax=Stephania japonica TaxID=461633 RepID=A0AAP0KQJ5_9MAGN